MMKVHLTCAGRHCLMLHVMQALTIGEMVAMMQVLVRPPSESASRRVSLESR